MIKTKICIVLTTRGNYAKTKSIIDEIEKCSDFELQLILGGMVVLEKYGRIENLLEKQGRKPLKKINFTFEGENLSSMSKSSGMALIEFSSAFEEIKPDIVLVIADRFECLPIAMAATYMNIPVAHIEGGEITGSIDESIRHAITKLSHIHFPASKNAADRIIKMGEDPKSVCVVGSSSMDVLRSIDLDDLTKINNYQKDFGFGSFVEIIKKNYIIVIQHPVTTEYEKNSFYISEIIKALVDIDLPTIWIMPNMDAGSDGINKVIRQFRDSKQSLKTHFFKSIPIEIYGPLLNNALCIVGNSSSGIREAAFLGVPSVNIGTRQNGRERGINVLDVPNSSKKIVDAIKKQSIQKKYPPDYLYGDGYSAQKIVNFLKISNFKNQKTNTY